MVNDYDIKKNYCDTIKRLTCLDWCAMKRSQMSANTKVYSIKSHKTKSIEILISSILNLKNVDSKGTQNGLSPELQTLKNMKN